MTMMELFKMGYTVTCGDCDHDVVMESEDDVLSYDTEETDYQLEEIDHEAKTAYFFWDIFADGDAWGEDL